MTKIAASGSFSQRHGSSDPDPSKPKCHGSATLNKMYPVLIYPVLIPLPPLFTREWCCGAPVPSGGSAGAAVGSLPGRRPVRGRGQPAVAAGRHSGRHGRRGGPHQRSQGLALTASQQERGQGKIFFSS
jgi:hypothetical protein